MSKGVASAAFIVLLSGPVLAEEWKLESEKDALAIHSRVRAGTGLREFKAVGTVEAPPDVVFAVLDDSEAYPGFMPYTAESRVLNRQKNAVLVYQRLDLPFISDRDYTLRTKNERWLSDAGPIYRIRWEPANEQGPPPTKGVHRVHECEGGWLLEPQGDSATRATYVIFTDSGGVIPPMLANSGSRMAIRKIFDAVRKQVKQAKYTAAAN